MLSTATTIVGFFLLLSLLMSASLVSLIHFAYLELFVPVFVTFVSCCQLVMTAVAVTVAVFLYYDVGAVVSYGSVCLVGSVRRLPCLND